VLRRLLLVLLAALAVSGCQRQPRRAEPWVWPGANRLNTFFFAQAGTRPSPVLDYAQVWEAEWFDTPTMEPVPAVAHTDHRPLLVDLDRDGRLEIVTAGLNSSPGTVLDASGVPCSGRAPDGTDWDEIQNDTGRIVLSDNPDWAMLPESARTQPGLCQGPLALRLNQRLVTLGVVLRPLSRFPVHTLECRDGSTGGTLWRYDFGARPDLMAVADLDSDGRDELLVTTYGEENGAVANGTRDQDSCYCVALREDGALLWQRGFGAHPFIGCLAGVADLNRDGRLDVFVNVYSWQDDFGGLAVLGGATGQVLAALPGADSVPVTHVSAGCADVDADGKPELAVAVSGSQAEVLLYRWEQGRLVQTARTVLSQSPDSGVICQSRLHGICDLDGDGKCELVVSHCHKRMVCTDPMFYPSRHDACGLTVLSATLQRRQEIPLPARCQDVTLGDLIPGGNIELLAITDRLLLYSTEAR
jgi:hypothetical protein